MRKLLKKIRIALIKWHYRSLIKSIRYESNQVSYNRTELYCVFDMILMEYLERYKQGKLSYDELIAMLCYATAITIRDKETMQEIIYE